MNAILETMRKTRAEATTDARIRNLDKMIANQEAAIARWPAVLAARAAKASAAAPAPKPKAAPKPRVSGTDELTEEWARAWLNGEVADDRSLLTVKTPYLKAMWAIASGLPWSLDRKHTPGCNSRPEIVGFLSARRDAGGCKPSKCPPELWAPIDGEADW